MNVSVSHESATDAARVNLALDPLVQAMRAYDEGFDQVELWPHQGVLVCRFVTHTGQRIDSPIGFRPLATMLGNPSVMRAGLRILFKRAKRSLLLKNSGLVLVGMNGQLNPYAARST